MKKLFIQIISLSICLTISGRYRGSDVLEKKQIVVKGFGLSDTEDVWSLEEAEISKDPLTSSTQPRPTR